MIDSFRMAINHFTDKRKVQAFLSRSRGASVNPAVPLEICPHLIGASINFIWDNGILIASVNLLLSDGFKPRVSDAFVLNANNS